MHRSPNRLEDAVTVAPGCGTVGHPFPKARITVLATLFTYSFDAALAPCLGRTPCRIGNAGAVVDAAGFSGSGLQETHG